MAPHPNSAPRALLAAPALATGDHPGGSPLAAAGAAPAGLNPRHKDEAPVTVGAGRGGNQTGTENPDFAKRRTADMPFATLRARLALAGHELHRTAADYGLRRYFVSRWSMVRKLRDIDAVADFAKQVGGAA